MGAFSVNIIGLSLGAHEFDYKIDDEFFKKYGSEILQGGVFEIKVVLDKHETFIDADFRITGSAKLICDRSLEPFDHPLKINKGVMFKYGEEPTDLTDEIIVIARDAHAIELGQFIYEFITLEIPMKKLHPRFKDEDDDQTNGKIVYKSESPDNEGEIDPRWEKLKKLK